MGQNASRTSRSSSGIGAATTTTTTTTTSRSTTARNSSKPSPSSKCLPKVLLHSNTAHTHHSNDDGQSRATASTGQLTPPSPLGSSSSSTLFNGNGSGNRNGNGNGNGNGSGNGSANHKTLQQTTNRGNHFNHAAVPPQDYNAIHNNNNNNTKNLMSNRNPRAATTLLPRGGSDPNLSPTRKHYGHGFPPREQYAAHRIPSQQQQQMQGNPHAGILVRTDKRSNPVKFPRRRQTICGDGTGDPQLFPARAAIHQQAVAGGVAVAVGVGVGVASPQTPSHSQHQDALYLERMYDSRTWEMYRRITNHREKVEAFHAANAAAKEDRRGQEDRHSATNETTASEPALRRIPRAETMARHRGDNNGDDGEHKREQHQGPTLAASAADPRSRSPHGADGVHGKHEHEHECYDHHVDHDDDDVHHHHHHGCFPHEGDNDWTEYSSPPSEEHSAPPYHHQRTHYFDSGRHYLHATNANTNTNTANQHHPMHTHTHTHTQPHCHHHQQHHHHPSSNNNNENYSEWEHMYGDVEDEDGHANGEFGSDPTIFLFDF